MGMPGFVVDFLSTSAPISDGSVPTAMPSPPGRRSSTSADKSSEPRLGKSTTVLTIL